MRVKPVDPNAVIRDPHTNRQLPAEGGDVPDSTFWRRRLDAGEVELVDEQKHPPEEQKPPRGNEPIAPLTTRREGK